jgi:hypothetical protein
MGAVENDEIGLGVGERAGGMGDLIGEFGNRPWRPAGDAAARHVNAEARRRKTIELRLCHAIDRRDDKAHAGARLRNFHRALPLGYSTHVHPPDSVSRARSFDESLRLCPTIVEERPPLLKRR